MSITEHTLIKRLDSHLLTSKVFDDLVMLDVESGDYFGLDSIGQIIWSQLGETTTLEKIYGNIQTQFEVSQSQFYKDVLAFLQKLNENGLLEISNHE